MAAFGMLLPLVGIYGRHYNATPAELTMLGGAFSIMQFLFAPVWGGLSDKFGRRPILLATIAGNTLSFICFGLARSYTALLVARAVNGVFAANISVAQAYVSDVTSRADRGKAMGMVGAAIGLGFVFGPPLGGISSHRLSLGAPGLIAAGLSALNWVLAFRLVSEPERERAEAGEPHRARLPLSPETFRFLRAEPLLSALIVASFLVTFGFCHLEQGFSLFLQGRFQLDTSEAGERTGLLLMWIGICGVFIQGGLIRRLIPKYGERKLLVASFPIMVVAMAAFPFGESWSYYLFVCLLVAVGSGIGNPSLYSLLSKSVGDDRQGYAMGLVQGFSSLARALGPISALSLFAWSAALPFFAAAALYALAFAAFQRTVPRNVGGPAL